MKTTHELATPTTTRDWNVNGLLEKKRDCWHFHQQFHQMRTTDRSTVRDSVLENNLRHFDNLLNNRQHRVEDLGDACRSSCTCGRTSPSRSTACRAPWEGREEREGEGGGWFLQNLAVYSFSSLSRSWWLFSRSVERRSRCAPCRTSGAAPLPGEHRTQFPLPPAPSTSKWPPRSHKPVRACRLSFVFYW